MLQDTICGEQKGMFEDNDIVKEIVVSEVYI